MIIRAKLSTRCPLCSVQIEVNEKVEWEPGSKARHAICPLVRNAGDCQHPSFHKFDCKCALDAFRSEGEARRADPFAPVLRDERQGVARDADDASYDAWLSRPAPILSVEDAGVYVLPDGSIVNLKATRDHLRTYAEKWVVISGRRLTEAGSVEHGEYRYDEDWRVRKALSEQVAREGRKMTLDEAQAFSLRFGVCVRCATTLKDAVSVKLGIGSTCIKYVDFDPEAIAAAKAEVKAALRGKAA